MAIYWKQTNIAHITRLIWAQKAMLIQLIVLLQLFDGCVKKMDNRKRNSNLKSSQKSRLKSSPARRYV